ncbi:helix-turn-helix transcriptional regulator [Mesorhizobium sp. ES1-6]|uniref:helix-turn-helix transcriptional regulator n=1 Tax=Mesorhizobium sp. ES1-6 TaxID=2876626 RepID=UPI001CCB50C8|nr:hypothetical protein [Mesorhizobium sp. ES1-6]MBZ9801075.1 hypothetical protein [Mesorhizobium sp. ES1-6]
MSKEILALVCPDWRTVALVLEGIEGHVAYANWHCLEMIEKGELLHLAGGRLAFTSADLNRRFYFALTRVAATGSETAVVIGREAARGTWVSIVIRNTQGFFRDALERNMGSLNTGSRMVVIEITNSDAALDGIALEAFAEAMSLTKAEQELVTSLVSGQSLRSIAGTRGKSVSNIRRRMKSVLKKTGCRRQAELVRIVMSLCPSRPH